MQCNENIIYPLFKGSLKMEGQRLQINIQGIVRLYSYVLLSQRLLSNYIVRRWMGRISLHI